MSIENEKTLAVYDKHADTYLETVERHKQSDPKKAQRKQESVHSFLEENFKSLPPRNKIFEIGSGDGKNAKYLESLNFTVVASDVSDIFIETVKKLGLVCRKFNLIMDEFSEKYDGVLAWRVFVHFTKDDLKLALPKIYNALRPGGIFVFNILNTIDHDNKEGAWVDFEGDYHMGVERYFNYYREEDADQFITDAGFVIQNKKYEGGETGKRWIIYAVKKPTGIKPEIEVYIENEILPQYTKLQGHTNDHIRQVIAHSLALAEDMPEVNRNMPYVIAAYHDLGRLIDDETHNIESGKLMAKDKKLREFFSEEEIKTMIEAVEDHRASIKGEPRSVYGKIVGSADRDMDLYEMLKRSYDYARHLHPEMTDDEVIEEARYHLRIKFSPDGYGAKKDYFPTPDRIACYKKIEEITRDPLEYRKIVKEFNKKRGL